MRVLIAIGACLFALLPMHSVQAASDAERSERARGELDALQDKIDKVRKQIATDKGERSDLSSRLAAAEDDISAASKRLRALDSDIGKAKQRVASLATRRNAERDELTGQLDALRAQVRAAYVSGRMDKMRLLLSGQSPEKLGRLLVYYEYFARSQTAEVAKLRSKLADLVVRQKALEREQDALTHQRDTRASTLASLKANQTQRRQTIAALDKRLSARTDSLGDMKADAARLEKLMRSLQAQLATLPPPVDNDTPFARLKGRMKAPVAGPTLARFGTAKGGGPLHWQGVWLAAAEGTQVNAVAGGRVVYVGYMHRYGLIVIIDHGNNYYTLYGHAESAYVQVGDAVTRGQAIARAGRSGGHTRSGTYFEIRRGQTPINPAGWLSG